MIYCTLFSFTLIIFKNRLIFCVYPRNLREQIKLFRLIFKKCTVEKFGIEKII